MSKETKEIKDINYHNSMEELNTLIRAQSPYLWAVTHEESRFLSNLQANIAIPRKLELWVWSSVKGLIKYSDWYNQDKATGEYSDSNVLPKALTIIERMDVKAGSKIRGYLFAMLDMHVLLAQAIPRQLRDMQLNMTEKHKQLIIVSGQLAYGPGLQGKGIEPTLDKQFRVVEFELPSKEEIAIRINDIFQNAEEKKKEGIDKKVGNKDEIPKYISAVQGLTMKEIDDALYSSIAHMGELNTEKLLLEKKAIIKRTDILEFVDKKPSFDDVGGLDEAKKFFEFYSDQFSEEAKAFGVEPLRGVLLLGVCGTGKSLLAKAVSNLWKLPLLRLDVGRVMSGIVGSSEARMREALATAQACAPCCLWCDEIEKALSGTKSSNMSDSGTLSRVFGTLLTAMEESLQGVVLIATANDITQIPPELIRRFNEVFFVDLPEPSERKDIFNIHLRKRNRKLEEKELRALVDLSHRYTGSEIEKSVQEGIARSWRDGHRSLTATDIAGALKDTKPISTVMGEQINSIRDWARARARYASSLAEAGRRPSAQTVTTSGGKVLDVDSALSDIDEIKATPSKKRGIRQIDN